MLAKRSFPWRYDIPDDGRYNKDGRERTRLHRMNGSLEQELCVWDVSQTTDFFFVVTKTTARPDGSLNISQFELNFDYIERQREHRKWPVEIWAIWDQVDRPISCHCERCGQFGWFLSRERRRRRWSRCRWQSVGHHKRHRSAAGQKGTTRRSRVKCL